MALLVAILLALFVLPGVWGWVVVAVAAAYEGASTWAGWRWSRGRRSVVGASTLVGRVVVVDAEGWARVHGERWRVDGAGPGERARVVAVEGLTLVVERVGTRNS